LPLPSHFQTDLATWNLSFFQAALKKEADQASDEILKLQVQVGAHQRLLATRAEVMQRRSARIQQLRRDLDEARREKSRAERQLEASAAEASALQARLAAKEACICSLERDLGMEKEANAALQAQLVELGTLRSECAQAEEQARCYRDVLSRALEALLKLQTRLEDLEGDAARMVDDLEVGHSVTIPARPARADAMHARSRIFTSPVHSLQRVRSNYSELQSRCNEAAAAAEVASFQCSYRPPVCGAPNILPALAPPPSQRTEAVPPPMRRRCDAASWSSRSRRRGVPGRATRQQSPASSSSWSCRGRPGTTHW
jgi:chromosome segregation ATPase